MQAPVKIRHAGCSKRPEPPAEARAVRVVRTFWKGYESPTPPSQPQRTVDVNGRRVEVTARGRHDACVVPRAVPVVEAMAAMVILDCCLLNRTVRL